MEDRLQAAVVAALDRDGGAAVCRRKGIDADEEAITGGDDSHTEGDEGAEAECSMIRQNIHDFLTRVFTGRNRVFYKNASLSTGQRLHGCECAANLRKSQRGNELVSGQCGACE
jgi:hypothetical protein